MRLREDPHLSLFFLLGRDEDSSVHVSLVQFSDFFGLRDQFTVWWFIIEETVMVEAETNNDVVIEDFEDTYSNLTLKSTFMLKWLSARCSHARFVLKVRNINNDNNNNNN